MTHEVDPLPELPWIEGGFVRAGFGTVLSRFRGEMAAVRDQFEATGDQARIQSTPGMETFPEMHPRLRENPRRVFRFMALLVYRSRAVIQAGLLSKHRSACRRKTSSCTNGAGMLRFYIFGGYIPSTSSTWPKLVIRPGCTGFAMRLRGVRCVGWNGSAMMRVFGS